MPLEIRTDAQLVIDGMNQDDINYFHHLADDYHRSVGELAEANANKDYAGVLDLEELIADLEFRLLYLGKNPKEIPLTALQANIKEADHGDFFANKYARNVRNPSTGVRAFCVRCMNGQTAEVRRCQSVTCPLWAFRMGGNPFFGKKLPTPTYTVDASIDDDVQVEEDDNENSEEN